jgi:hypothetical protein
VLEDAVTEVLEDAGPTAEPEIVGAGDEVAEGAEVLEQD